MLYFKSILLFYYTIMVTESFGFFWQALNFIFGFWGLAIIVVIFLVYQYNAIISIKNKVGESFSSIDTVLQNRYNIIPNLIEVVKQYASHEKEAFENVSKMRSELLANSWNAAGDRFEKENQLQAGLKSIFAIAESYPDLKASTNYLELQTQWSEIEDRLQGARRAYNAAVKIFKDKKEMFPSSLIAGMMKLPVYDMFEAEAAAKVEKMDAKVLFNS